MSFVDKDMYVKRSTHAGRRNPNGKGTIRGWYLVKAKACGGGYIPIGSSYIHIPIEHIGKKVKIKIEVIE